MRRLPFILIMLLFGTAKADDTARTIIDRALQAHGGEKALRALPAWTAKVKGTFHGLGQALPFTGEIAAQVPVQQKLDIVLHAGDVQVRFAEVLNGKQGWTRLDDKTDVMDEDELAQAKAEAYSSWVAQLVPLADKRFTLGLLGELKVKDRPAIGVKVSSKGQRDVQLWFDKENHRLVKIVARVIDDNGLEVAEETFLSDYREVQGTMQAMRFFVTQDGKPLMEGEITEFKLFDKLEDSVFGKP